MEDAFHCILVLFSHAECDCEEKEECVLINGNLTCVCMTGYDKNETRNETMCGGKNDREEA